MRTLRGLILSLIALQVGCVSLPPQETLIDRASRLSHQQEYASALQLLDSASADHPDYPELLRQRETILALAKQYEDKVIVDAASAAAQGLWTEAFAHYEQAMKRLPASAELITSQQRMAQIYHRERSALELELMLARADWLYNNLRLVQNNIQWDVGGDNLSQRRHQWRDEAVELADALTLHGEIALESGELHQAKKIITAASRLNQTPRLQHASQRLQSIMSENEQRKQVRQAKQEQSRRDRDTKLLQEQQQRVTLQTVKEAERAFATRDLPRARQLLYQLSNDDAQVKSLRTRVDSAISSEINKHHELGSTLYSQGKFTEAIGHWRQILKLEPDNGNAKFHIDRAERVLSRLQQLKRQQARH